MKLGGNGNRRNLMQSTKDLFQVLKQAAEDPAVYKSMLRGIHEQVQQISPSTVDTVKWETVTSTITKAQKLFRAKKRAVKKEENKEVWGKLLLGTDRLLNYVKEHKESIESNTGCGSDSGFASERNTEGLPESKAVYLARLQSQRKELYKNPPVLPPTQITVESEWISEPPNRNRKTGQFTFAVGADTSLAEILKDFTPNTSPQEVLREGAFGGTYFRTISSAVTNQTYSGAQVVKDTLPSDWVAGLDSKVYLTSSKYHTSVNKFGVSCGGSLGMWESSGWIADVDPYGWFQWYCRFFQGRRSSDDARQIARWKGVAGLKGRFRSQLCNKILAASARPDDASISPVIRQTLLHWGLLITEDILEKHRKRTGR